MATTYEAIATVTVGSGGAANIEFTSIAANWTDLIVKFSLRGSTTTSFLRVRLNGNSSAVYSYRWIYGTGSGAASLSGSSEQETAIGDANKSDSTANIFNNGEIYLPNYAGSSNKSFSVDSVTENNATPVGTFLIAGLWANTSAVTSLNLYMNTGTFAQYSTATLYGIKNS